MKRGYLWLDWVELGCRGWHLDESGAALDQEWQPERCCEGDHAHLDRTTLHLVLGGCRRFTARVFDDLRVVGLLTSTMVSYDIEPPGETTVTTGSGTVGTTTVRSRFWHMQQVRAA